MTIQISVPSGVSTYVSDAYHYAGDKISVSGKTLYDVSFCGEAALYYLNSRSSYDAFLLEGQVKRTDRYTQQDYNKAYDNTTIEFGRKRFLTEIKPTWELNTGWLDDNEAKILCENLLPSTQVYLHLLGTDEIIPVVITDTAAEYKTYENQKDQLVSYKISVEASQTDYRD